ncbi:amino acid ABC transporter substrate-binding protein [Stutzerimonas stutzeri]|uniref:Amino acid ABC transporter substrate-binding protein n=1 Tax=Stutzerimonas stutzeri TaxID=316 RepID=A0A2N8SXD0_STUST|nr:transporter substrate-binding domain-containing protein [Stutzerimonas stutzeri]MCQ4327120.1 transporter substrate-binding domain-containing protein [Stutzerimonas stutzeri]PNG07127.1 amino acid ABC transporter substrate-binding protein [Stutzerimonas stutzeri]
MPDQPIRIGGLFSDTGVTSAIERSMTRATLFAIEQINEAGGIDGRPLELVLRNPDSTPHLYARHLESLIRDEGLQFFFGCYTSSTRKAALPVLERHDALLFYPVFYEGFEYSRNVIYTGATQNHNNVPLAEYMFRHYGTRVLMVGSDYVYPYEANRLMSDLLYERGGTKLGEYYLPLNAGRSEFDKVIEKARQLRPSFIFSMVVGDSMRHLYQAYAEAGLDPQEMPIASLVTSETEIQQMGAALAAGHITAATYFQSVDTPANRHCVAAYQARFGANQVTDMCWDAAYFQVHLFAEALRRAGRERVGDILQALRGLEFEAPQGLVRIDMHNHHSFLFSRIGRVNRMGQFDLLFESRHHLKPDPYVIAPSLDDWSNSMGSDL